jgi:glutathione S-transferase
MPNAASASVPVAGAAAPARVVLEVRRTFAAARERVFDAWTSAASLKRWHAPENATVEDAHVDFRVGGGYEIRMRGNDGQLHRVAGEYREIDRPRRLVLSWAWQDKERSSSSVVTVEFYDRGPATEVVLTHTGLETEQEIQGHRHGWIGCLDKLATVL